MTGELSLSQTARPSPFNCLGYIETYTSTCHSDTTVLNCNHVKYSSHYTCTYVTGLPQWAPLLSSLSISHKVLCTVYMYNVLLHPIFSSAQLMMNETSISTCTYTAEVTTGHWLRGTTSLVSGNHFRVSTRVKSSCRVYPYYLCGGSAHIWQCKQIKQWAL